MSSLPAEALALIAQEITLLIAERERVMSQLQTIDGAIQAFEYMRDKMADEVANS